MKTIATLDLDRIHEICKKVKKSIQNTMKDFLYFLANFLYLDPDLNLEIALKLRPYAGLIVIDCFYLRLHAILHDALGFVYEYSEKVSGYSFVLHCSVSNEHVGHVTGIAFCLYLKPFKSVYSIDWNVDCNSGCS